MREYTVSSRRFHVSSLLRMDGSQRESLFDLLRHSTLLLMELIHLRVQGHDFHLGLQVDLVFPERAGPA